MARLAPGRLNDPVAMRRIHDHNRICAPRLPSQAFKMKMMYWKTLWRWSIENLDKERQQFVLDRLVRHSMFAQRFDRPYPRWARGAGKRLQLLLLLLDCPALIKSAVLWRQFVPSPRYWVRRLRARLVGTLPQDNPSEGW